MIPSSRNASNNFYIALIHLWVFLHRAVVMCLKLLVHWLKYRLLNRRELCIGFQMVRLLAVRQ